MLALGEGNVGLATEDDAVISHAEARERDVSKPIELALVQEDVAQCGQHQSGAGSFSAGKQKSQFVFFFAIVFVDISIIERTQ